MAAKRDLYEVLEISPDADDAELKKAYRRAALKWHPDKNQDNLEEASVRFKEVQEAYETLSDPQERAWYDDHKDDILHGSLGDENKEPGVDPEDLNLKSYCSASAYLSDPAEFFVVYSKLFNTLDEIEERAFGETDDNDDEDSNAKRKQQQRSYRHAPPFGSADSDYDDVKDFYSHYLNFVTYRSFSWADKWQLPTAPSRHIRRLMAKENRKEREKARKTYCDDIRAVLEFVRKHDPRVKQHKKKLKEEAKLKEAEAKRAKAEEKKRRAKERKEHLAHEFERMQLQKEARRQMYGDEAVEDSAEDEDEEEEQDFHCVVCEKSFRSEGAWRNHEKSKLHKKNVAALQKEQRKHGTLSLDEESQEEADTDADSTRKGKKNRRKKGKKAKRTVEDDEDHKHDSDSEDSDAAGSSDGDDYFPGDLLLECEKGHKLVFTSDRGAAYAGESEWDCNRCAGSKSGKSYHCSQCLFDMCKRCAREHQKLASLSKFTTAAVVTDDHVADVDMDADAAETMSESKHSAKDEFECSTCQVTFLSKAKMKAHKRSAAHKLKMMQVGSTGDSTSTPSETVHAGADADADADADVATETDSVADNAASNDGSDKKTASSAFDCAVCSMSFKSAHKLKAHKRTTIHKKKLQEKEAAVDEDLKQELNNIDSGLAADDNDDDDDGGRKKKKTRGQSDPSKASDKAQRKAEQEIRQKKREQEEEDEAAQTDSKPATKAASKAASKAAPAGSSAADKSQDKGKKRPQGKAERKR